MPPTGPDTDSFFRRGLVSLKMASGRGSCRIREDTELVTTTEEKHKYVNTAYKKVPAKMYDHKCDIKLQVDRETFRAHKEILAEASDYFSAMFSHSMIEKEQDAIELHGISPRGFTSMMDYFYHGHVTIESTNVADVIEAARFFHIEWLINVCVDFLVRHMFFEHYDTVVALADKYFLGDLSVDIFEFVSLNFVLLAEKPKFVHLSYELLLQLLSDDNFVDAPETYVFRNVLKWLRFDEEKREEYKITLMKLLKLPLVDLADLENAPEELQNHEELKELFDEAKEYQRYPTKQCLMASERSETRGAREALVMFAAVDDANTIQYKIPGVDGFFSEAVDTGFLDSHFEFASIAVLGNFLFIAGGYDRNTMCSSPAFYCFNPRTRQWAQLSSMLRPRVSFDLVAGKDGVFAVAGIEHVVEDGIDRERILHYTEFYDPIENEWSLLPEMPLGCFSAGAIVADNRLWVSGGVSDDVEDTVPVNYLNSYQICEREWVSKAPMLQARQGHAMEEYENKIYVFGGYTAGPNLMSFDDSHTIEMYDIETDQWTQLKNSPEESGHLHNTATKIGDQFVILGGKSAERYMYVFNTEDKVLQEGELAGDCICKVVTMNIAIPPTMIGSLGAIGEEDEACLEEEFTDKIE